MAFNVSHSHGLALVALTLEGRLGVDLEKIRPEVEWRSLAQHYFSDAEVQVLDRYAEDIGLKAFYTCWTPQGSFRQGAWRRYFLWSEGVRRQH